MTWLAWAAIGWLLVVVFTLCLCKLSNDDEERAEKATALARAYESANAIIAYDLEAHKKAKAENDERFMLERDEARADRDRLREELEDYKAYYLEARVDPITITTDLKEVIDRIETRRQQHGKA